MKATSFKIPKIEEGSFKFQEDIEQHFYDNLHTHPEIQLTYILSSHGTCFIGHHLEPFQPNEIYLIGSNIPHVFKNDEAYYQKNTIEKAHGISLFFKPIVLNLMNRRSFVNSRPHPFY